MNLFRSFFAFLLLILFAGQLQAASLAEAKDRLARLEQAYENRELALEDIENDLEGYSGKLESARQELTTAETASFEARKALAVAKSEAGANPDDNQSRVLKKATHAHKMSDRSVRTATKRLERLERNQAELLKESTEAKAALGSLKSRISTQGTKIKGLKTAQARASAKAREREAEAARAAAAAEVAVATEQLKVAAEVQTPEAVATPEPAVEEVPVPQAAPAEAIVARAAAELSDLDAEAVAYARKQEARLADLLADGETGVHTFKRPVLEGSKLAPKAMQFLGKNQYRVEQRVTAGKQVFTVGRSKFRRTIPTADEGATYVFILDAKRPSRPRLVTYNKALVD